MKIHENGYLPAAHSDALPLPVTQAGAPAPTMHQRGGPRPVDGGVTSASAPERASSSAQPPVRVRVTARALCVCGPAAPPHAVPRRNRRSPRHPEYTVVSNSGCNLRRVLGNWFVARSSCGVTDKPHGAPFPPFFFSRHHISTY